MLNIKSIHTNTVKDSHTGTWYVELTLNGTPCGAVGPIVLEQTADIVAEGLREGMRLAIERAQVGR